MAKRLQVIGDFFPRGDDGLSAYEIAKSHGFEGTEVEWLESLNGETGPQGPAGSDANVTADNIKNALGYTPADAEVVSQLSSEKAIVPDYWLPSLEAGAEAINTALCNAGRNKSSFLFYTDAHWDHGSQMAPTLLKYLYQHTGMTKTFFGGDIVNSEASDYDTMAYLWEWRKQLKDLLNHHSVPGNHDDGNSTNNLFSEQYVYGYLIGPEETPDMVIGDGLYYYIDSPAERTRYLCLDTGYKDLSALSSDQSAFITESLKSTPSGWHIVVVAHIWYVPDYTQYSERPVPLTGLSATAASVATILDNYNSRVGDFADCSATVEFCIGGHVHYDYVCKTDGGIPIILCETDSAHIRGTFSYEEGTTTESSMSGIIANYDDNTVNIVRVGRGNSFVVDINNPTKETRYTINKNLTNVSSSSALVEVAEGDSYNTTLTATSGEMTSVIVTMGGVDVTSSVYNSSTGVITIPTVTGNVIITAVAEANQPAYTNVLDTVGYTENYRLSGSSGNETEYQGTDISGFIPYESGQYLYLKNVAWKLNDSGYGGFVGIYYADKSYKTGFKLTDTQLNNADYGMEVDENGYITKIRLTFSDVAYVRVCALNIDETSIITVNEPIE